MQAAQISVAPGQAHSALLCPAPKHSINSSRQRSRCSSGSQPPPLTWGWGINQKTPALSSPQCRGCCSGSGGSKYRTHGCTGDPWKNVACRWWPAPGARSSQRGPRRTWELWLEREEGMAPNRPLSPLLSTSCHHQTWPGKAGLLPGSRNWKGKLCSPAGRLPAETEGDVGRGDSGALRGHYRTQVRNRRHCSRPVHTESDSEPQSSTGQRRGTRAWLQQERGMGLLQGPEPNQIKEKLPPSTTQALSRKA